MDGQFIEFSTGMFISTDTVTQFAPAQDDEQNRWLLIFYPGLASLGYQFYARWI